MSWTGRRLQVGAPLIATLALAGCVDGGTKLGALPPVTADLYLNTTQGTATLPTNTGLGSAMFTLVPTDPARCITLSFHTAARINGASLSLDEDGGSSSTQSGTPYCIANQYDGTTIPLGGDATLILSDDTATFRVVATGALEPGSISVTSPADAVIHIGGTEVQLAIPARGRTVTYAGVFFVADGASAASFSFEFPTSTEVSVTGDVLSFFVPTAGMNGSGETGAGTLSANLQFADEVTTCDGPAACAVFTGMVETTPATLAN